MNLIYTRTIFVLAFLVMCATESRAQLSANFVADTVSGCAPHSVTFSDLSTGSPSTWSWDFGDGGTSVDQNPIHFFNTSGQYTVTLTVGNGSTTNTAVKTNYITVFQGPVVSFSIDQDTICSGTQVTLTSTTVPGDGSLTTFNWTFNDGNPAVNGTASIQHVYSNLNTTLITYSPVLRVTDSNGCADNASAVISVFPIPTASLGIASITSCATPATVTFSNASTNTNNFSWDFGDPTSGVNNTSNLAGPSHTFNTSGNYLVTLTAGVPGCSVNDTMTINIVQPAASFTVDDSTVCRFSTVNFTNTSVPLSAVIHWDFGDPASGPNDSSAFQNPAHFYSTPGTYVVTLTVTAGSCTSTRTMNILVRPNPSALFYTTDYQSCDTPFTVAFLDTVSNIATWSWTFGDVASGALNTSSVQNPSHTFNNFGYYNIKLVVVDIFGCTDSLTRPQYIQVVKPVVDIIQMDSGCVGSTFNLTAIVNSPANPNVQSYVWDFGDGTGNFSTTTPSTSHQFNTVGIFDITVTITTTDGCTATVTKQGLIRVGTRPIANFSATPLTLCFQQNVQFTDLTPQPVTGWQWSFGDGGSSISQNPSHEYNRDTSTVADPFDVTLIAYYNGCPDDTTIANLIVVNGPIPLFSFVTNCATPLTVPFTNLSGGATSYSWNFGDGSPLDATTSPSHTFPGSGDYNVTLTATSTVSGCVIDTILQVRIRVPSAVITASSTSVCKGNSIQFSSAGSVDVASIKWTFGEGIAGVRDTSYAADTLHLYQRPGFYTVTLTVTDINGCVVTQTQQVHILGPIASFTASPMSGCAPISVTFTDTSTPEGGAINQWVWNYGTGADTTSAVGVVTHEYTVPGFYGIRLTVTDVNGCTDTHFIPSFINPSKVTASITNDTTGCRTTAEIFNADAGFSAGRPVTYSWNFGDGSSVVSDTINSATHSYLTNGTYPVYLLAVDNNGCRDSVTQNMFIYTTPAVLSYDTSASCLDSLGFKTAQIDVTFHSDSNAYGNFYQWNLTIATNLTTLADYNQSYAQPPGNYDAFLILINAFGCRDTSDTVTIHVPGPTGSFTATPTTGCTPLGVQFTGLATGSNTFAWDFGDGSVISGTSQLNVNHTYLTTGEFYPRFLIGFQIAGDFCYIPAPPSDTIRASSLISANIDSTLMCITDGGSSTVNVSVSDPTFGPYTYTWSPAAFVTAGPLPDQYTLTTSGQSQFYTVAVGYGAQGCAAFDSVQIDYCPCLDKMDSIPNVFTPNGDNRNDFFEMKALCYYQQFRIIIFNRWGKKMYESTNPYFKWDGRTDGGTECSEGVYYWIMDTKSGQLHGYLELIRK